jgi:hypothetical protein
VGIRLGAVAGVPRGRGAFRRWCSRCSRCSRTSENFDRWIRDDPGRSVLSDYILRRYGEPHACIAAWPLSMRRSVAFFRRRL